MNNREIRFYELGMRVSYYVEIGFWHQWKVDFLIKYLNRIYRPTFDELIAFRSGYSASLGGNE